MGFPVDPLPPISFSADANLWSSCAGKAQREPQPCPALSRHFLGTKDHHEMGWALFLLLGQWVGPALTCFCFFSEIWE